MTEGLNYVFSGIEKQVADKPAASRRQFVAGAAATLGGLGLLSIPSAAKAGHHAGESTTDIINIAATAEVLATIVNTIGFRRGLGKDAVTQRNIKAAAREELVHYNVLTSLGATPLTKRIWVPDAVFASRTNLLNTLQVGDQIFVNAYLIATLHFGNMGNGEFATYTAEFMGVEGVHRALARQSLGLLGNDRVFMKFDQVETAVGAPNRGQRGFEKVTDAVGQLQAAGFGFGAEGAKPGRFYHFDNVKQSTPNDPALNTFRPDAA